ncbi:MAG: hypothetical protein IKL36_05175 [Clostridia bacterium]|nr:hypothetical protein [Clostridia bacterium]
MKKAILSFLGILLILSLLSGCNSDKDSHLDNSTPSQTESSSESNNISDLSSLFESIFGDNPIELPDDESEEYDSTLTSQQ